MSRIPWKPSPLLIQRIRQFLADSIQILLGSRQRPKHGTKYVIHCKRNHTNTCALRSFATQCYRCVCVDAKFGHRLALLSMLGFARVFEIQGRLYCVPRHCAAAIYAIANRMCTHMHVQVHEFMYVRFAYPFNSITGATVSTMAISTVHRKNQISQQE